MPKRGRKLERLKKQGIKGKRYIFYRGPGGKEVLINNKYGNKWWRKATWKDIRRVTIR